MIDLQYTHILSLTGLPTLLLKARHERRVENAEYFGNPAVALPPLCTVC